MASYQGLYSQKKIPLYIAAGNGVARVEDQVPDSNYVIVDNRFPGAKNTGYLKCEWKDFSNKMAESAVRKI
jgi:hypothetical protein